MWDRPSVVSVDGGISFSANFPLEPGQSDATATDSNKARWDYFDYTGLAYYGGFFYPAWAENSNVPGGNPDFPDSCGSCTNRQMDIFVARVRY